MATLPVIRAGIAPAEDPSLFTAHRYGNPEFLGFRRDVPDVLRGCDALVSPTRYEAYGLNVHEAICCGLPALVSRSAGVAERYPAALDGLLIPDPDDPADLARRLRAWRDDRAKIGAEVAAFSDRLRATTWDDMAAGFLQNHRVDMLRFPGAGRVG